ncbi:retrovirus-related pol polyprotein from transposon TNT 1-94 [Tanacetum coccineum]
MKSDPEQGYFWSIDDMDRKNRAETSVPKPISALTVYPPNTPVKLVPRVLPTKSQVKINLYVLTQLFTEFDKTCKKRITLTGVTEGKECFERTKRSIANVNNRSFVEPYNAKDVTALIEQNDCVRVELEKRSKGSIEKQWVLFTSDTCHNTKVLSCAGMYTIDIKPIPHPLKNNRSAHLNYISHLKESVETCLGEIVERTSSATNMKHEVAQKVSTANIPMIPSTRVNTSTEASGSKPRSNTKKNRILPVKKENKKKVECDLQSILRWRTWDTIYFSDREIFVCDSGLDVAFRNATCFVRVYGVGIFHQKSVPRTPQQNGVVERRNRTLVEAARTMMIFSKAPIEDLGKFQAKADIGIFVGYAPSWKGYRIYNKRTRRLIETIHVTFDEMHQTMAPVRMSSGPGPFIMTPGQLKLGLTPTDKELEMTSLSTTISQDAPSTSASSSTSNMHHPVRHQGIAEEPTHEDSPINHDVLHPSLNPVTGEPGSAQSSYGNVKSAEPTTI